MKDYLNALETDNILTLKFITIVAEQIKDEWGKRKNLTEKENIYLDKIIENGNDFFKTIGERLSSSEISKLNKRIKSFQVNKIDNYQMEKIFREAEDKMKTAVIEREYFEYWCEEIMDVRCKGCDKHWEGCTLHNVFEQNLVPEPTGYEKDNCRFAYEKHITFKREKKAI